jgi:LEA14-like dessication related protein
MRRANPQSLLLTLLITLLAGSCTYVTKPWVTPGVNLVGIRPAEMTFERQRFIVSLRVNNPNDRTLPIQGASYRLEVEGRELANGSGSLDEQIPAYGEGVVDLEVNTDLRDLIRSAPALAMAGGRWGYRISGVLRLAGGYVPVPFRYSGEVEASDILRRLMR